MKITDFSAVVFDLDGTIYYGSKVISNALDVVNFFRNNGIKVFFGTNNSSKTRKTICDKLNNMGISCSIEEVITSGFLASIYCLKENINNIFVYGTTELIEEFQNQGIELNMSDGATNLVIGFNKDANYSDLTTALRVAINSKRIIACNVERNYPGENSLLFPSCGGTVKAIEWCSNRSCDVIVGKPNSYLIDYLMDKYAFNKKILVIGDSFEFDVEFAYNAGATPIQICKSNSRNCLSVKRIGDIPNLFY